MSQLFRDRTGVTMAETLVAVLLISVVFLAIASLYAASEKLYIGATDYVAVNYELQPAMQHVYEHVMLGVGDKANPPIIVMSGESEFSLEYVDKKDNIQKTGYYRIADGKLEFDKDNDGVFDESFGSASVAFLIEDPVTHEQVSKFYLDASNNMLKIQLTAEFSTARAGIKKRSTLYTACYPRLASFN